MPPDDAAPAPAAAVPDAAETVVADDTLTTAEAPAAAVSPAITEPVTCTCFPFNFARFLPRSSIVTFELSSVRRYLPFDSRTTPLYLPGVSAPPGTWTAEPAFIWASNTP